VASSSFYLALGYHTEQKLAKSFPIGIMPETLDYRGYYLSFPAGISATIIFII
jgi:hypothetical protein